MRDLNVILERGRQHGMQLDMAFAEIREPVPSNNLDHLAGDSNTATALAVLAYAVDLAIQEMGNSSIDESGATRVRKRLTLAKAKADQLITDSLISD